MMRNPKFRYVAPTSVDEALRVLADHGPEAMPIAGGTDLIPKMKRRQFEPKVVIGLSRLRELASIDGDPASGLVVGAGVTLAELRDNATVRQAYPAVSRTMSLIANPLIQNMGTIGGNLCLDTRCNYYDQTHSWRESIDFCMKKEGKICWVAPSSPRCWAVTSTDSAPLLIAMDARVTLRSVRGDREIPAGDLFRDDGMRWLDKEPDELLTAVRLPAVNGWRATYRKLRRRGSIDFPVLGVGAWARFEGDRVAEARIVLGAVGSRPHEVPEASSALIGRPLDADSIASAAEAAYARGKPLDNTDFMMNWRKRMIREYVTRALGDLGSPIPAA
jgi:4-hydroxybenzoyl-CoA reductase subunit beta